MRYYLDFDRTVFDTEAFYAYVEEREGGALFAGIPREEYASTLHSMAHEGKITFDPGELSQFIYPDAAQFLRDKENAVTIITFGDITFQQMKVKSALHGIPRMSVIYTGDVRKGEYLAPHTHLHEGAIVVDDLPIELEGYTTHCAPMQLFEIRRNGAPGDGRWSIIRLLTELP